MRKDKSSPSSASSGVARAHLIIEGRVQGVFYRATARATASVLGIKGWVRNLPDGSVEAIAEGPEPVIDQFVEWCQKGPPGAFVTNVRIARENPRGEFNSFEVRY